MSTASSVTSGARAATFERLDYSVASGPAPEPDEWMRRLGELPLQYQPGVRWQYDLSNEVTGVLVSRVTGQPLETFLRERILDPLGMNDTAFHVPPDKIDRLPPLYGPDPQTGEFTVWDQAAGGRSSTPPAFQGAGGGLVSTADDYHCYFRMLLNHGMHGSERILSRTAVELMTTNRLSPRQQTARHTMFNGVAHLSCGQGTSGGWGFGMAVRTARSDYAPPPRKASSSGPSAPSMPCSASTCPATPDPTSPAAAPTPRKTPATASPSSRTSSMSGWCTTTTAPTKGCATRCESGDRRMAAWVLARHAMVPLNYGAPQEAARLAALARREAGTAPTAAAALSAAVTARALAGIGDTDRALRALRDVQDLDDRLDGQEAADTWFGYPSQKHFVHLSQAYTLLGNTSDAYAAQEDALALTTSPSVMTRALLAMDTAACLREDGDPTAAAEMAAGVLARLPGPYRDGLVRSRADALHRQLTGRPHDHLGQALA
ncbi:serine hydrolase [Streptomyces sp. NPDC057680]|uniref:serine hydrolase n=1 Tax=Streptomyces sp. NPDC057680 TaxID=3346208 RepID=UPI0036750C8F